MASNQLLLDLPEKNGVTTYYSPNILHSDIEFVQKVLDKHNISTVNTRLFKLSDNHYQVRIAGAEQSHVSTIEVDGRKIDVEKGDYSPSYFHQINENLQKALKYAANDNQKNMVQAYITHFANGNIDDHKDSQRHWIKDKGPIVETNMGFIETYRDPYGVRAEFESFVSVVDKETSKKFEELVTQSETILQLLPWPKIFEKDHFLKPDFTSLQVLTFVTCGIPSGINIPNYDDIRQNEGFKNVSLGNVISANLVSGNKPVQFIPQEYQELYKTLAIPSFEVQVGLHELLGHGSGKLLSISNEGVFNFDKENSINPITNQPIESWYLPGQGYDTIFTTLGSSMEECRAECVGIYLSVEPSVLRIFGHNHEAKDENDIHDVTFINWLSMARAGVKALEFYTPEQKKWRQAHMQARFAIFNVLLNAGQGLLSVHSENDDVYVQLDRSKILSVGVPAIRDFLLKLNVYKATANFAAANEMFNTLTVFTSETKQGEYFTQLREKVIALKQPRMVFVQARTALVLDEQNQVTDVKYVPYEATPEGIIQSFVDRAN